MLVRRAREPGRGRWSVPGGKIEPGETDQQALIREVVEETGLRISVLGYLGSVRRPGPAGAVFDIHDYRCRVDGGALRPGDDADDARWCDRAALARLPVTEGLLDVLRGWHCLPRR